MSTVVIFGGAGFIGSALSNLLCEQKTFTRIVAVGRSSQPKFALNPTAEYIYGNAAETSFVAHLIADADAVVDLCYSTVPKTSFDNPLLEVTLNLPACINIMQQCVHYGINRYLLVSSGGTVYGNTTNKTITESHPTNPISPYGISKLMMEKYAFFFHRNFGLSAVVARPSNPYGLLQIGDYSQGFIGNAISCIRHGRPATVYGDQGTVRDYIYIDDLAQGLLHCLLYGAAGEAYNIGTGVGMNNLQALSLIESIFTTRFVGVEKLPSRPFDVNFNVLDSSKIRGLSGWMPTTNVISGLKHIKESLR